MKTSEQVNELFTALAKAQGEMKNPEKNKTATIPTKAGGSYSYNYADLPVTYDVAREALSKNGLSHFAATSMVDGCLVLQMRVAHSSGQWVESEVALPDSGDPKSLAANLTYFRRYLFTAIVGLAADEDTDSDPENDSAKYQDRKPSGANADSSANKVPAQTPSPAQQRPPVGQVRNVTRTNSAGWTGGGGSRV